MASVLDGGTDLHQGAHHYKLCRPPWGTGAVSIGASADIVQRDGECTVSGELQGWDWADGLMLGPFLHS